MVELLYAYWAECVSYSITPPSANFQPLQEEEGLAEFQSLPRILWQGGKHASYEGTILINAPVTS